MGGLLADVNIDGHVAAILRVLNGASLRELWEPVELPLLHFRQLGLTQDVPDDMLWHVCQQQGTLLITGNRNDDGPDSLESTIRSYNKASALPVFTLASPEDVLASRAYAERVAFLGIPLRPRRHPRHGAIVPAVVRQRFHWNATANEDRRSAQNVRML